jgi:hypothetical protein
VLGEYLINYSLLNRCSQLGSWIYQQKKNFNKLSKEKREKLVHFGIVNFKSNFGQKGDMERAKEEL